MSTRWTVASTMAGSVVLCALLAACARPPRPSELAHAERVASSAAMRDAASLAPLAVAHARQLQDAADKEYEAGHIATATILAEQALVAYERAAVLARAARARASELAAKAELAASEATLRELEAEQARVDADTESLEHVIHAIHDAEPVARSGATSPDREQARFEAARSIAADARLLCVAAGLLGRPVTGLSEAQATVARLEETLEARPRPVPIDDALRLRAQCLAMLTLARRADTGRAADVDVVLTALTQVNKLEVRRDDRGIVVTLRGESLGSEQAVRQAATALAPVALAYSDYPLLLVAHTSTRPTKADVARLNEAADRVQKALESAGIAGTRIHRESARGVLPVLAEPIPPPKPSLNERVEVILISPRT